MESHLRAALAAKGYCLDKLEHGDSDRWDDEQYLLIWVRGENKAIVSPDLSLDCRGTKGLGN